jgi:hypothetical protein
VSVAVGLWLPVLLTGAAAADATAGAAAITEPGQDVALDSGGSATHYGVSLPDGARCPGDTEHDEYHVFTFLFPHGLAPSDVSFKSGVPDGFGTQGRLGLFADGEYVGALDTAPTTGQVDRLPDAYSWTRLTPKVLFTGGGATSAWDAGIVCANRNGVVTNYWDTEIVFRASPSDPGGFTWSVPKSAQVAVADGHSFPIGIVLVIAAVVLGTVALVMGRRRRLEGHHVTR